MPVQTKISLLMLIIDILMNLIQQYSNIKILKHLILKHKYTSNTNVHMNYKYYICDKNINKSCYSPII